MHPDNAIQILNNWAAAGIQLTVNKPTREMVDIYLQSKKGIAEEKKELARRERKQGSRKEGSVDKLTKAMTKMYNIKTSEINSIKKQTEVGA